MNHRNLNKIAALVVILMLGACSSSSGTGASGGPLTAGKNWDALVWDQDNWS